MQQPALIATDLDGTLLGLDERVSPRAVAVINRALAQGVPLVLATGRPPRWIPPIVAQLGLAGAVGEVVCANGAVCYDPVTDRVHDAVTLPPATLADLAELAGTTLPGCGLAVERVGRSAFDGSVAPFVAEPDYLHAWPNPDHGTASRAELLRLPAIKLLIRHPDMTSDDMAAALGPLVGGAADLTFSNPFGLLEVCPAGVTKATGVAAIAARGGVAAADVIAFGDMPNDLEMLRWAGHGVAMANAHPDLLAAADEVTASNVEDGFALVLERWF